MVETSLGFVEDLREPYFNAETFEARTYRRGARKRPQGMRNSQRDAKMRRMRKMMNQQRMVASAEDWRTYQEYDSYIVEMDASDGTGFYGDVVVSADGHDEEEGREIEKEVVSLSLFLKEKIKEWMRDKSNRARNLEWSGRKGNRTLKKISQEAEGFDAEVDLDYYNKYLNYEKNGTPIEKDGYELSWGLAELNRKELIEEILGSFEYDYLLENNMVRKIDDREEEDAIMKLNYDNLFGAEAFEADHPEHSVKGKVRTMSGKPHSPRKMMKDMNISPEEAAKKMKLEADMDLKESAKVGFGFIAGLTAFRVATFGVAAIAGRLLGNNNNS